MWWPDTPLPSLIKKSSMPTRSRTQELRRVKEVKFRPALVEAFPDASISFDIPGHPNLHRPFAVIDMDCYIIIVDCAGRKPPLGGYTVPVVLVSLNMGCYVDEDDDHHVACFGCACLRANEVEWKRRMNILRHIVQSHMDEGPLCRVSVRRLCFDGFGI